MDRIIVEIAGIGVRIDLDNIQLFHELTNRYHEFIGGDAYSAHIRILADSRGKSAGFITSLVEFQGGKAIFNQPGYNGFFDHELNYGELALTSSHCLEDADYFLRVVYAIMVFEFGGLLFHAAGIVRKGQAYIFFGHSGSGKTTVARLSPQDVVLNDDLLLLIPREDGWQAYATPFWNPSQIHPHRNHAPLKGFFHLVQDQSVFLRSISKGKALAHMVSCVPVIASDPSRSGKVLERCSTLLALVPSFDLHFLPDNTFWQAIVNSGLV